jgi:hypothetical protein
MTQGKMRPLVNEALHELSRARAVRDWIPAAGARAARSASLKRRWSYVHNPPREASIVELAAGKHPRSGDSRSKNCSHIT